ncbi:MAG: hypothetical protein RLZ98_1064 [Pseudomonadota bacterium]|jgi:muconate cycloisomerase/chloromuconate cycloisomerase
MPEEKPATSPRRDGSSDLKIADVKCHALKLPYKGTIKFRSVSESAGQYAVLRIILDDGSEGLSEAICRPEQQGEDAKMLAYQIETFFKPVLIGHDPLAHLAALSAVGRVKGCRTAKGLIDVALWDLKGKVLGQPVWRLLGGDTPKPVPLTWLVHGNSRQDQVAEAIKMHETRGYNSMKLKTWKRSLEDVRLVEEVRRKLGDSAFIYVDGNGSYSETEARTILANVSTYNVAFIEEPCTFTDPVRMAALAADLPVALLGDQSCSSLAAVQALVRLGAVGAVSVKLKRTGFTESLKIIALAEAAGLPVVIGTDSESRLAAASRMHLRAALPSLAPYPTETHFFDKLADDVFIGDFNFSDGTLTPDDSPGFGAGLDMEKLNKYAF